MSIPEDQHDGALASDLLSKVYQELRRKAHMYLNHERTGHTLNATALVHEAYLKLAGAEGEADFEKTGHFVAAATEAMRRILIDHARARLAEKRGGDAKRASRTVLDNLADVSANQAPEEILALEDALSRFEKQDAQAAQVVRLRFFAGLDIGQTAKVIGISPRTVKRHWQFARAWLYRELEK